MADFALEMIDRAQGHEIGGQLKIGMHVGPLVAGVIGHERFSYDVWGDTVNLASRLESHGLPGKIHCSQAVYETLSKTHQFEKRGEIEIKGHVQQVTWYLGKHGL